MDKRTGVFIFHVYKLVSSLFNYQFNNNLPICKRLKSALFSAKLARPKLSFGLFKNKQRDK